MSVLVKGPNGQHYVFIKGSFEAVAGVSNPATVPSGYIETGKAFSLDGCYVLGVGFKKVGYRVVVWAAECAGLGPTRPIAPSKGTLASVQMGKTSQLWVPYFKF